MKQPRDKNGRFTKIHSVTGERNLTASEGNFLSERSNFNISKVESNANNVVCYLALFLTFIINISFIIYGTYHLKTIESAIRGEFEAYRLEIENVLDTQNEVLNNHIFNS